MQKNKNKGSITPLILVFGSFFLIIFVGLLSYVLSERHLSIKKSEREMAFNIAESGLDFYRWHLSQVLGGKNLEEFQTYWESNPLGVPSLTKVFYDPQGEAVGEFILEVSIPVEDNFNNIKVRSTGYHYSNREAKRVIETILHRSSWNEFAVLSNEAIRFDEGAEIFGMVHSNTGVYFNGISHNLISASQSSYWDTYSESFQDGVWTDRLDPSNVFLGGKEFPVPSVDFKGILADLSRIKQEAENDGVYLGPTDASKDGYHLKIKKNGTIDVYFVKQRGSNSHNVISMNLYQTIDIPNNGVIFVEDNLSIEGIINNEHLTIAAADLISGVEYKNIFIEKDIVYSSHDGESSLGLIAQGDIRIGLFSSNTLRIDGALIAQNGSVGRDYYTYDNGSPFYNRDNIIIYGSIASNLKPVFGWYCQGGKVYCSGYKDIDIIYDSNFDQMAPPLFPLNRSGYVVENWEELK